MGRKNSSMTRVVPVFDRLYKEDGNGESWLRKLLSLPIGGHSPCLAPGTGFSIEDVGWGSREKRLAPPVSLLSWLIRNPRQPVYGNLSSDPNKARKRQEWIEGSGDRILEGLSLLRANPDGEDWHIFEGKTQPDVYIQTPDLLTVIEGKRTEKKPTTSTKWMVGRHQMLRHLDCAWEIAARRKLLGFFIVEGVGSTPEVPDRWVEYAGHAVCSEAKRSSLPHRGPEEQAAIVSCFAGVTTWQRVCAEFDIPFDSLPDVVEP